LDSAICALATMVKLRSTGNALGSLISTEPHITNAVRVRRWYPVLSEIDFVIAWVDGSDPAHIAARRRFTHSAEGAHAHAALETRFYNSGEIYYLIASILKYAPFVRRVHIVTDNQKPALLDTFAQAGLCDPTFLQLVSHDVIFRGLDAARPTFNPRPIEASLWRIPDLAEHFVYSNDDMFVNAPLSPEDLFRDGKPVLHGEMVKPDRRRLKMRIRALASRLSGWQDKRPKHRLSQERGAVLAGAKEDFFYTPHHPHPLRRSVLERFYESRMDVLREQVKYRFRNAAQYNAVALSNNLEIRAGEAVIEPPLRVAYLRPDKSGSPAQALAEMRQEEALFGCVQSLEKFPSAVRAEIHDTLRQKFRGTLPPEVEEFSRNAAR